MLDKIGHRKAISAQLNINWHSRDAADPTEDRLVLRVSPRQEFISHHQCMRTVNETSDNARWSPDLRCRTGSLLSAARSIRRLHRGIPCRQDFPWCNRKGRRLLRAYAALRTPVLSRIRGMTKREARVGGKPRLSIPHFLLGRPTVSGAIVSFFFRTDTPLRLGGNIGRRRRPPQAGRW